MLYYALVDKLSSGVMWYSDLDMFISLHFVHVFMFEYDNRDVKKSLFYILTNAI